MRNFITVLALIILTSPLFGESKTFNQEKANEILLAVENYYIKGLQKRDFSLIRAICIDEAKLYSVRLDSSISIITLDKWSERFDPNNPPFITLEHEILKVDYEGTAAQVKIKFVIDNKKIIHDFLNLLKIKGEWRIVNIIDY